MSVELKGVDSVEFAVKSIKDTEKEVAHWGFVKLGQGKTSQSSTALWGQGKIRLLLTQGENEKNYASQFVKRHGDGICDVSFLVDDAAKTYSEVTKKGAKGLSDPKKESVGEGEIVHASVASIGDVTHSFVSRLGTDQFSSTLVVDATENPDGYGMFAVDHLTCNMGLGELDKTAEFYEKVFGFKETRFFNISTERTGLVSKVMENKEGTVKIPINEPIGKKSQIQEYIDANHGPGVQHLALLTSDIVKTLMQLKKIGQKFLDVPDTYYDAVPKRVPNVKEDMRELQKHRILVDGDKSGYLLQIFSQNVVGPFFYEVIQRAGNKGFGEGNFRALFEAIERDQERRGVL